MKAEEAILSLLAEREEGKSICPSEAAKRLSPEDWRPLMSHIRTVGRELADAGKIEVLKKGKVVDPHTVKGVIRFRLASEVSEVPDVD
ncbi:MAG: DUF3253 domain-containing protein [Pseudomonadota bacterium]